MKHFLALDALRGLAAISVILFHFNRWLYVPWLASNAYLAVDFFFCLSGYVLSIAYSQPKYKSLSFQSFIIMRLIRLLPMVILASFITFSYLLAKFWFTLTSAALPDLWNALILGLLSVPNLAAPASIGGPQVFPLNGPQYTLFLEILVNAFWFATRGVPQLPLALSVSAVSFMLLGEYGIGGDTVSTVILGVPRVCASFFAGVALFHATGQPRHFRLPWPVFTLIATLMIAVFFVPTMLSMTAVLIWVILATPALIFAGANISVPKSMRNTCAFLGALSYPLYALHFPLFCWGNGILQAILHRRDVPIETPIVIAEIFVGSALALVTIDQPTRGKLSRLFQSSSARPVEQGELELAKGLNREP